MCRLSVNILLLSGLVTYTIVSRCGSGKGSGRSISALMMVNMAVFAPAPNSRVRMATAVKPGLRRRPRNVSFHEPGMPYHTKRICVVGRALRPAKAFLYRPVWQSGLWRPQDQRGAHSGDELPRSPESVLAFARNGSAVSIPAFDQTPLGAGPLMDRRRASDSLLATPELRHGFFTDVVQFLPVSSPSSPSSNSASTRS